MIDNENAVFTRVAAAERAGFPGMKCYPEQPGTTAKYPCLTLVEMDNAEFKPMRDLSNNESGVTVMYQADAYSNLDSGRKAQCKAIINVCDAEMRAMGFTRISLTPETPAVVIGVTRYTARYTKLLTN